MTSLVGDDFGLKFGVPHANCQRGFRLHNQSVRDEDMGGNIKEDRHGWKYKHEKFLGAGSTYEPNISNAPFLPLLPVPHRKLESSHCPNGIANSDSTR